MSSTFFYSQDSDCPICSPKLHPTCLDSSFLDSTESLPTMAHHDHAHTHTATLPRDSTDSCFMRRILASGQRSNDSISSSAGSVRSSSALSSTPSSSSSSSSRNPVKKVLANMSARRTSPDPHKAYTKSNAARTGSSLRMVSDPMQPTPAARVRSGPCEDIHPYNFFEASLHMGEDLIILRDGWLRVKPATQ
jgi:hypothetical protein